MTADQFQRMYHGYNTTDREAALEEAASVEIEDVGHPHVVEFPFPGGPMYCLMLPSATKGLRILGINGPSLVREDS